MSFLNIIEAVTERLSEIDTNPGNLIFDIVSKRILFDNHTGTRITISDIEFIDTEVALLASAGIENKLYIAKDTSGIFYYSNGAWKTINASSSETQAITKVYVSESGSDTNSGLTLDECMKTLAGVFSKYSNVSNIQIYISGSINTEDTTTNILIANKTISISGDSKDTDIINQRISFSNCAVTLDRVTIPAINITRSNLIASNCIVNGDIQIQQNSLAYITDCTTQGSATATENSFISIANTAITGDLTSNTGSCITLNQSTYSGKYTATSGRIYLDNKLEVSTQEAIQASASKIDVLDEEPTDPPIGYMYIVST